MVDWFCAFEDAILESLQVLATNLQQSVAQHAWKNVIRTLCKISSVLRNFITTPDTCCAVGYQFCRLTARLINMYLSNEFRPFLLSCMTDIAQMIFCIFDGAWCSVAVMTYYHDYSVEGILMQALDTFVKMDVQDVMGLPKRREYVFRGITAALAFDCASADLLAYANVNKVWQKLSEFLLKCLQNAPLRVIVDCHAVLLKGKARECLSDSFTSSLFQELVIMVSTGTYPPDGAETCCSLIQLCHSNNSHLTEGVLEHLLEVSSAYHRVRLRCLLMMLRNPPSNVWKSFVTVFGTGSRTAPILSAW